MILRFHPCWRVGWRRCTFSWRPEGHWSEKPWLPASWSQFCFYSTQPEVFSSSSLLLHLKNAGHRVGEVGQWVTYLLYRCEALALDPRDPGKAEHRSVCISLPQQDVGQRQRQENAWAKWQAHGQQQAGVPTSDKVIGEN